MNKKYTMRAGLALFCMIGAITSEAREYGEPNYAIQALLGGARYDGLEFETTADDGSSVTTTDMSRLPQLGGAWSTLPKGDKLQFGLECSFLLGFKFDDVTTYNGAHGTYVDVSSSLWLFDIAGGAYLNLDLGEKLRVYGAAGPVMMVGLYNTETDYNNVNQSETEVGFGLYARAGLELKVQRNGYLGAGLRGTYSSLDFSEAGGSSDLKGIGVFLTYTAGL